MHPRLHLYSALSLGLLFVPAAADAAPPPGRAHTVTFPHESRSIYGVDKDDEWFFSVIADGDVAAVWATLSSERGEEELTFVESDTWLHGAAMIGKLPEKDTKISVYLYSDVPGQVLRTFSGALGADGSVTLSADVPTKEQGVHDVELVTAEVFAADGGYDLSLDLNGADAFDVAYGELIVSGNDGVTTRVELDWDGLGVVWVAEVMGAHDGLLELKTKTWDAAGKKLETLKSKLGVPWLDEGAGVVTLATDEDPLTSVGVGPRFVNRLGNGLDWTYSRVGRIRRRMDGCMTVMSSGWGTAATLPTHAELELVGGETVTVPANSYQRRVKPDMYCEDIRFRYGTSATFRKLYVNDRPIEIAEDLSVAELSSPSCSDGMCVMVTENAAGEYDLSVTAYDAVAADLPATVQVTAVLVDEAGVETTCSTDKVELEDEIVVVFATELGFTADPLGMGLSGKVSLLGPANRKGKQATLSKGKFYGSFARDPDGEFALAGADKDEVVSSGELVRVGDSIAVEEVDTNKDGVLTPPAAVAIELEGGAFTALGGPFRASK